MKIFQLFTYVYKLYLKIIHIFGRVSGEYYFEDYLRVYPDSITYYPLGLKRKANQGNINNFLNHSKFYTFASQFVKGKTVVDVGCGSGYGAQIIKDAGAKKIYGCDISKHSINFAKKRYGRLAEFSVQGITNLNKYPDNFFDVTLCAEVLEHIAEYGMEDIALNELKRITKKGGMLIISTPNSEIMGDHGFSFRGVNKIFGKNFKKYLIFENVLIPLGENEKLWNKRVKKGDTGIIISEKINKSEIAFEDRDKTKFKKGKKAGKYKFGKMVINTRLLHNTHSWIVIALKD